MIKNLLLIGTLIGCTAQAATTIGVEGNFLGGIFGTFAIEYDAADDPAPKLKELRFDLQAPLYVDASFIAPGALLPFPYTTLYGSTATGFTGASGIFNGSTSFSLLFDDFDAGERFGFELDIDEACKGIACIINGLLTSGNEFAGTQLTALFGGGGFVPTQLVGQFVQTGALTARADLSGVATPEPASMALLGFGLCGIALFARKRRS